MKLRAAPALAALSLFSGCLVREASPNGTAYAVLLCLGIVVLVIALA